MNLFRAFATVSGFTMLSRVLGFVRDVLIAALVGAGLYADVFFVAFKLPNFFRRLFAEGAFSAGFIPIFADLLTSRGRAAAADFAGQVLVVLLIGLLFMVTLFQLSMPWVMHVLAPGFADDPEKFALAVQFTRITFPYLLFISLVSLLGGILNSLSRFAAAAFAPVLLNLCLIGALTIAAPLFESAGHALPWGVAVAGAVQLLWMMIALRRAGIILRLPRPRLSPKVRELLILILPVALGAGVVQINLVIDIILASLLPEGSISYLFYADRLNQLPLGVVGVALGTALLPLLSRQIAAGENEAANRSLNRGIELTLLLAIPAAAALAVTGQEIITTLFQRGAFSAAQSQATAMALMAYAVGLPAYVLIKVLGPGYFARRDTKTPVRIALVAMAVNIVLNLILMQYFYHAGLALATAISAWLNAGLMAAGLIRRGHLVPDMRLRRRLPAIVGATVIMALVLWGVSDRLSMGAASPEWQRFAALSALVVIGLVVFILAGFLFKAFSLDDLRALRSRNK